MKVNTTRFKKTNSGAVDLRTKEGRALKAKRDAREARILQRKAWEELLTSIPAGGCEEIEPVVGGTGVAGAKYVPLNLDSDPVSAPNHYTQGGIETIDFIRAKLTTEQLKGYYVGNLLKYISRADFKGGVEDYKKAQVYLTWLVALGDREI